MEEQNEDGGSRGKEKYEAGIAKWMKHPDLQTSAIYGPLLRR